MPDHQHRSDGAHQNRGQQNTDASTPGTLTHRQACSRHWPGLAKHTGLADYLQRQEKGRHTQRPVRAPLTERRRPRYWSICHKIHDPGRNNLLSGLFVTQISKITFFMIYGVNMGNFKAFWQHVKWTVVQLKKKSKKSQDIKNRKMTRSQAKKEGSFESLIFYPQISLQITFLFTV